MSALRHSRNKPSLNESFSRLNRLDERNYASNPTSQTNTDELFGNLNSFRTDLRKQIGDRMKTTTKFSGIETPSPSSAGGLFSSRQVLSTRADQGSSIHADLFSALKGTSNNNDKSPARDRSFGRGGNNNDGFLKPRTPIQMTTSRIVPSSSLSNLSNNLFTQRNSILGNASKENYRSNLRDTPLTNKSHDSPPLRQKLASIKGTFQMQGESKLSAYESKPYDALNTSANSKLRGKTNFQEDLNKIFDSVGQQRTPQAKANFSSSKTQSANPLSELSQELNRIRNQGKKEFGYTPSEKVRETGPLTPSGNERSFTKTREKYIPKTFLEEEFSSKNETKKKTLGDVIPLNVIHEFLDAINDVTDEEFNTLPSAYIEELVKLSSGIMHRVKTSDYYINDNTATITQEQ